MTISSQQQDSDAHRQRMLELNREQQAFYETPKDVRGNLATKLWARARRSLSAVREELGVTELVLNLHQQWLEPLEGKRVLDLGCFAGNRLSLPIARRCGFYLGIDLSQPAIAELDRKLRSENLAHAHAKAMDFLSADFSYPPFEVIYAYGVLHHFEHFETLLQLLHARLAPGGVVVSWDPLETAPSMWLLRRLYRPFQSDKAWEFPFNRRTFDQIQRYFDIEAVQGVMGAAKWGVPLALLRRDLVTKLHRRDVESAKALGPGLWRCMQVALLLKRKDRPA